MKIRTNASPFGSPTRTRVLIALRLLTESHARELTRLIGVSFSTVQKALRSLEEDGLVAARAAGRTRLFRLNPRTHARRELEGYLDRLAEAETRLSERIAALRRRPRRSGKPM